MLNKTKNKQIYPCFSRHWKVFLENFYDRTNHDLKRFNMIYHSTHSDDYLWYLILREEQKKKKKQG